jgi:hypothetical protein
MDAKNNFKILRVLACTVQDRGEKKSGEESRRE